MFKIGCHLSSSNGYLAMAKQAIEIGANTFQFFTRNPRGGQAKPIDEKDINEFLNFAKENGIEIILAHASYTLNASSADEGIRKFAKMTMKDDLRRMEYTPGNYYNFHPGSHVGQGVEQGIEYIAEMLNEILTEEQTTIVLLETMAGKGSEIGRNFNELKSIIDKVILKHKIGVCLDTCHIWDGGYDIVNDLDKVLDEFNEIIGLEKLKAIHLNDSINEFEAHKDRHSKIGEGKIGLDAIVKVINNTRIKHLPFYLETPNELDGYKMEIELLKKYRLD